MAGHLDSNFLFYIELWLGFGIPFFTGATLSGLIGCGVKDLGCGGIPALLGFIIGMIILGFIYYFLTLLVLKVLSRFRHKG